VNQQAERIIFSKNADGTVTAIVQLQYIGPSGRFAWVLPVPGTPYIGVSSNIVFSQLQARTNPQFTLNTTVEGARRRSQGRLRGQLFGCHRRGHGCRCRHRPSSGHRARSRIGRALRLRHHLPRSVAARAGGRSRHLVDGQRLRRGRDLLGPYLADGMNLVAFRLPKQATTGDIQPIRLTYDAPCPMIPLKLTAAATQPDMPVMVWVLGESRAIPSNYRSLELNEAAINWLSPSSNYDAVIRAAARVAGGQGFVTEMSGLTSALPPVLHTET